MHVLITLDLVQEGDAFIIQIVEGGIHSPCLEAAPLRRRFMIYGQATGHERRLLRSDVAAAAALGKKACALSPHLLWPAR